MKLNNKLKKIAELVPSNSFVLDVGCDHALLLIYLSLKNINIKCLGVDINNKPLLKALDNIKKYHVEKDITLKQGNGLEYLNDEISHIVISGMGGILINDIILKDIDKVKDYQTLILCPNSDSDLIRKSLTKNGFKLINEVLIEDKYIYEIMVFKKGKDKLTRKEIIYGKYLKNDKLYKKYLTNKLKIAENIVNNLPKKYFLKKIKLLYNILVIKKIIEDIDE